MISDQLVRHCGANRARILDFWGIDSYVRCNLSLIHIFVFETWSPRAAQQLVDITSRGPSHAAGVWQAWAVLVGVFFGSSMIRNLGFRFFWNPLAAHNMEEMTNEGFRRVQSFSADWHGDTFAGATVRRLSRAMWGYDVVSDSVIMWIGPALVVLLALSAQLLLSWPIIGIFSLAMVAIYIACTIAFSTFYVRCV